MSSVATGLEDLMNLLLVVMVIGALVGVLLAAQPKPPKPAGEVLEAMRRKR